MGKNNNQKKRKEKKTMKWKENKKNGEIEKKI